MRRSRGPYGLTTTKTMRSDDYPTVAAAEASLSIHIEILPIVWYLSTMTRVEAAAGHPYQGRWTRGESVVAFAANLPIWLLPVSQGSDPGSGSGAEKEETAQQPLMRVLIVEDEVLTADYLQHLLIELGYEVCGHATSAAAALNLAGLCRPDIVLMDVNLGRGGDGIGAARQILDNFGIRSLFVTAYGDRATLSRAQGADPVGLVLKPFDKQRLAAAIAGARLRLGPTGR